MRFLPSPVRVGFICPSLIAGGGERWMLDLARHCSGHAVVWSGCVVTGKLADAFMHEGLCRIVPVHQAGVTTFQGIAHAQSLNEAVEVLLDHSDIIIIWEADTEIVTLADPDRVHVIHVSLSEHPIIPELIDRRHWQAAVSAGAKRSFGDRARPDAAVIPSGVDLNRCTPVIPAEDLRASWKAEPGALVIGCLARIDPVKNHQAIARALTALPPSAIAVCYGALNPRSAAVKDEVKAIAGDRLQFYDSVDDIGSVLAAIDVFMLPSRTEASSNALLEAWAAGVPVVATDVGMLPELEAKFGELVCSIRPDASADKLAGCVRYAFDGQHRWTDRARSVVFNNFSVKRTAALWTDYLRLVAGST